jgi:putative ABC transport system ATP-binding protein
MPCVGLWAPLMLSARGLGKSFVEGGRAHRVLHGLSLDVGAGETVALTGASGSGKSTLLNLLSGIEQPDAGTVSIDGIILGDLDDAARTRLRRRHIGFVFQFFNLLPTLSVLDNVVLPQRLNGVELGVAREEGARLLSRVGLAGRESAHADRLSGGEQQRVALVRAVAHRPSLVLADEPTGNLDTRTGDDILALLRELVADQNLTLIMATHSAAAAASCDRVLELADGVVRLGSARGSG